MSGGNGMGARAAGTGAACLWSDEEVFPVFMSRYMPCELCGESVDKTASDPHECSPERRADYQMFALRAGVAEFEDRFRAYVETAPGQFDAWLAAKQVRHAC
jgi:hypothetical protein